MQGRGHLHCARGLPRRVVAGGLMGTEGRADVLGAPTGPPPAPACGVTQMLPLRAGGPRPRQQPGNLKAWVSHLRGAHQPGRRISRDPDGGPSRLLERQGQGSGPKVSRPCICSLGRTQPPTCQPQGHFNSHLATCSGDMSRHFGNIFGIELEESCDSKESRRRRTFRGLESRTQSLWDPVHEREPRSRSSAQWLCLGGVSKDA